MLHETLERKEREGEIMEGMERNKRQRKTKKKGFQDGRTVLSWGLFLLTDSSGLALEKPFLSSLRISLRSLAA